MTNSVNVAPHALVVGAETVEPKRTAYFLHGILGSGGNLRSLAKRVLELSPGWDAVLVDLPAHGRSAPMPPPHTVQACAEAISRLADHLGRPLDAVVGHSFGGKVALVLSMDRPLHVCCTLDSTPGPRPDFRGSESTMAILDILRSLPPSFSSRASFGKMLELHGLSPDVVAWLALNLAPEGDSFHFRLDLIVIRKLLADYFALDAWPALETPKGLAASYSVVLGEVSNVWDAADRARAMRLPKVPVTILPKAGHWVHVDAPERTALAIQESLRRVKDDVAPPVGDT